ncbi:hypothetical protein K4K60_008448 [Colletotrichum sp. SAR11_57]|nr:hypothetical protein K4K60_008448 [Colletotrichum sp. SAR11_57]
MSWVWRVNLNDTPPTTEKVYPSPQLTVPNGAYYHNRSVYWAQEGNYTNPGGIVRMNPVTLETEIVLNNFFGHRFNSPNDVVITRDGVAYFTDGYYGYDNFNDTLKPELANGVWRWDMGTSDLRMVAGAGGSPFTNPNGVALNLEEDKLYVTNRGNASDNPAGGRTIYEYQIHLTGLPLRGGDVFAYADSGFPDGIKVDRDGRVYGGVTGGVSVFDSSGKQLGIIKVAEGDVAVNMQNMGAITTTKTSSRPSFSELPLRKGDPKASAWGLWGAEDELGTLNLLNPSLVKAATAEVVTGDTTPLNHWDGPRHYPYQSTLQYYNGVTQDDISGPKANLKIGIQNIANKTITGRGVLLDWYSWAIERGIQIDPFSAHGIPLSELKSVASAQKVHFRPGDILLVRTGWLEAYRALSVDQQAALPRRQVRSSCGVEATEESIQWHWDNAFAAVASDTVAYEAWPSPKLWGVSMHEVFLSGWGMPIGESFDLEDLAAKCNKEQRWSFMFVSVPLNVPGGVASPPGAVAIF